MGSAESVGGRLGAVLSGPRTGVVPLGQGAWLTTSPAQARQVLTDTARFDFPDNVVRSGDLSASRGDTRSGHVIFAPLTAEQLARGLAVFAAEWMAVLEQHDRTTPHEPYDGMALLRRPVSRATCAAVLTTATGEQQHLVADRVLAWIDSLAPVISAARPPHRWSRRRRRERDARYAVEDVLAGVSGLEGSPQESAVMLAAGIQVPIAAGAWLLAWAATDPWADADPASRGVGDAAAHTTDVDHVTHHDPGRRARRTPAACRLGRVRQPAPPGPARSPRPGRRPRPGRVPPGPVAPR